MNKTFILVFSLASLALCAAQAATVKAIKDDKAIIEFSNETLTTGAQFYLVTASGKKTGLLVIRQVKGNKALAEITKGKGRPGQTLLARSAGASSAAAAAPRTATPSQSSSSSQGDYAEDFIRRSRIQDKSTSIQRTLKSSWGLLGSLSMNTMNANVAMRDLSNNVVRSTTAMSGTSFGLGGFYDKALTSNLALHINGAYETFSVSGETAEVSGSPVAACAGTTKCKADISYLSGSGLLKWYPSVASKYRFWLGGGLGYMMNMGSSSNALSSIGPTPVYGVALGTDIQFGRQSYMPIILQYSMFPDSPTVKANMILLKIGWAWNL